MHHLASLLQGTKNHKTYGQNVAREVVESPRLHVPQKTGSVVMVNVTSAGSVNELSHVPGNVAKASQSNIVDTHAIGTELPNAFVPTIFH